MKNQETPYFHTYLNGRYVGLDSQIECYIFLVTALPNRPLLFTCHMDNGAIYSRLPIDAFSPTKLDVLPEPAEISRSQKWGNLGTDIEVIQPKYLKDYSVFKLNGTAGSYLFSVDFIDGMFSEDPEQHKILHLIEFKTHYEFLTNNECLFWDSHFCRDKAVTSKIKRTTKYWSTES